VYCSQYQVFLVTVLTEVSLCHPDNHTHVTEIKKNIFFCTFTSNVCKLSKPTASDTASYPKRPESSVLVPLCEFILHHTNQAAVYGASISCHIHVQHNNLPLLWHVLPTLHKKIFDENISQSGCNLQTLLEATTRMRQVCANIITVR
jgi:hypothetical protein